jgi:lactate dehydrogenase-like 2-hydroxyacid dehydrogenase
LLAVARNIDAADAFVRDGRFKRWETTLLLGMELRNKTLGIVGMGRIGAAVARRALGFGMRVVYHNRQRANPTVERQHSAHYVAFDTLLDTSDVVSLHCPLNDDSHHLIDAAALRRMKDTALLINTARGPVVDEAALVDALRDGEIAGAGLDVFEAEPEVHPGLQEQDRVVLAPHLGSATRAARTRMGEMVAEAVLAAFAGAENIPYRVV